MTTSAPTAAPAAKAGKPRAARAPAAPKFDDLAHERVTKAVASIVLDDPFYGYLLLRNELQQDAAVGTACTDGRRIRYAPQFVRTLSTPQLKGLLKHEVMHIAHLHHLRRGTRQPERWNMAADYVINAHLVAAGVTLPEGGLVDPAYVDDHTEHVYELLPDPPAGGDPGGDPGDGSGTASDPPPWNWGGVEDAPGAHDEATRRQMEEDARIDITQAANAARVMGKLPAHLERLVERIQDSRMPWRQILARFFRSTARADYSWLRPNRRFLASGLYLPSLHSEACGPVVIGVDTSGSVQGAELDRFFGCINAILKTARPEAVHVVYCDAAVQNVQVFRPEDYPLTHRKLDARGGGGTDFRPVFEHVRERRLRPAALLYLTDMEGTFPDRAPGYSVIWCAITKSTGPFGKTLEIR